jgi:hypothetical protein
MEFADLLSRRGRRVLEGRELAGVLKTGRRFIAEEGLLDAKKSRAVLQLLEREVAAHLTPMEQPIPPQTVWGMKENYAELLPKTVRVRTVTMASRSKGAQALERTGIAQLLRSESFGQFAAMLSGRKVRRRWGTQVLRYARGDYAGPHNDHHPEDREARDGYTDVHLTFCSSGVKQLLVYAPIDHFSEQADVATLGGVTAYRLPFWHYTTPLLGNGHRWVLLGTFIDEA